MVLSTERCKHQNFISHSSGLEDQFAKYSHGDIDKMNKDYDIKSLMHYSSTAFGIDGKTTIVPIDPTQSIGDAEEYTALDIVEINALYDCKTSSICKCSGWPINRQVN